MLAMVVLSLRNMGTNKTRFGLTTSAVLLGVSFVVASFVLSDGLRSSLNSMVDTGFSDTDAQVRAESDFDEIAFTDRQIDQALADIVAGVDGVEVVNPNTDSLSVTPLGPDGEPLGSTMSPVVAVSWDDNGIGVLRLVEGEMPGPGEFALDRATAEDAGMVIGESYDVIGVDGPERFELVGINQFGEEGTLSDFGLASFPLAELQRLDGSEGLVRYIDIGAEPGVDVEQLALRVEGALPAGVEVIAHDMATDQLEGRPAGKLTIILKFESAEAARSAYNSEAYQQLNPQRLSATSNQTGLIVEGL